MVLVKGHGTDADKEFREALSNRLNKFPLPKYRIAMELGISQGQLSGILNNTRSASLGLMEKIAKNLGTTVADMLMEGRRLCGKETVQEKLTAQQLEAIEAFKTILLYGGELADELTERTIAIARKKRAEAGFKNYPPKALVSKSA